MRKGADFIFEITGTAGWFYEYLSNIKIPQAFYRTITWVIPVDMELIVAASETEKNSFFVPKGSYRSPDFPARC